MSRGKIFQLQTHPGGENYNYRVIYEETILDSVAREEDRREITATLKKRGWKRDLDRLCWVSPQKLVDQNHWLCVWVWIKDDQGGRE